MRIERRLFINPRSHWSYVCVMAERFELMGWKVVFRPEINAIDIIKYSYEGHDVKDDMNEVIKVVGISNSAGEIRVVYDLNDPNRQVRYIE